ncbi:MAG: MFS transporter [Rhodothermales bacterium]|nr:MFS transporter [Rhodothermales bacterium]MBO6778464.1 MFS transporter [Rhodothermales bacterium]
MLDIQKRLTNTFYALLSLPATAMGFALSVQISALSWILSTKYGLAIDEIGLVWAAGPIAGILGQVVVGIISDNVWFWGGRRRPFMLIGGVLATLMLLALPSIDVISTAMGIEGILGVAIAVALTLDLAINVSFNPTRSVIADVTPEGVARTKGYTWMQTVSGTFGVLAYAIGAVWGNYVLIYFGAGLVLVFSVIPPFFIDEPRELGDMESEDDTPGFSAMETLQAIRPLWGFLIYAVYGMTARVLEVESEGYWVELICLIITVALILQALLKSEDGKSEDEAGMIGFKKVLAAHSFTWIGVQAMFIYMFAFIQYRIPGLSDDEMGRVVSISFLILNAVGALVPVLLLEPITERIGRVRTHLISMFIMAGAYAGIALFGSSAFTIYLFMALAGIGWGATVSLPFAIMSVKVNQSRMGLYMGLFNLSVVLPQLVASLGVGAAVAAATNKNLIFFICAGTLLFSGFAWLLVKDDADSAAPAAPASSH